MVDKIIVFDVETVADVEIARRFLNISDENDEQVIDKLILYHKEISNGNTFFRQMFWKIVCLSYLETNKTDNVNGMFYTVKNVKSAGEINSSERDIIEGFSQYCKKYTPRLVSFNGKIFDIPVIKYRAMKYKLQFDWFYQEVQASQWKKDQTYNDKWGDKYNFDLLDFFKPKGGGGVKMAEVCSAFNIPVKVDASGDQVEELYKKNDIEVIRNYCETDTLATFALFLITEYHMNNINKFGYEKSFESLLNYCGNSLSEHISKFGKLLADSFVL